MPADAADHLPDSPLPIRLRRIVGAMLIVAPLAAWWQAARWWQAAPQGAVGRDCRAPAPAQTLSMLDVFVLAIFAVEGGYLMQTEVCWRAVMTR